MVQYLYKFMAKKVTKKKEVAKEPLWTVPDSNPDSWAYKKETLNSIPLAQYSSFTALLCFAGFNMGGVVENWLIKT